MIVLDSSVLVGIIRGEPDMAHLVDILDGEECAIGAPTLVETRLWCTANLTTQSSDWLEEFIDARPGTVVPFSREMADVAEPGASYVRPSERTPGAAQFRRLHGLCRIGRHARPIAVQGRGFRADGRDGASGVDPAVTASDLFGRRPVLRGTTELVCAVADALDPAPATAAA